MTRKTFAQIVTDSKVDISREYYRLYYLIYRKNHKYSEINVSCSIVDEIGRSFTKLRCCGNALSFTDFNKSHCFNFQTTISNADIDTFISFLEYWYNIFISYIHFITHVNSRSQKEMKFLRLIRPEIDSVLKRIDNLLEKVSYMKVKDGVFYSFVEKSPAAVSAAEVIEDQSLSIDILMYNHRSMKGDIDGKRTVLNKMSQYLEPRRKTLETVDKKLANDLFNIFNNFNIRHNNIDPSDTGKFNQKCADMKNEELEALYDDTCQMFLLATLEIENIDRKERIKSILE